MTCIASEPNIIHESTDRFGFLFMQHLFCNTHLSRQPHKPKEKGKEKEGLGKLFPLLYAWPIFCGGKVICCWLAIGYILMNSPQAESSVAGTEIALTALVNLFLFFEYFSFQAVFALSSAWSLWGFGNDRGWLVQNTDGISAPPPSQRLISGPFRLDTYLAEPFLDGAGVEMRVFFYHFETWDNV